MPTYEYRCPVGHTFEMFQRFDETPLSRCEVCGEAPVQKVLYPAAIHFKGSGFYSTDYGRGGKKPEAKEGEAASVDGKKAEEAKPAKAEPKAAEA